MIPSGLEILAVPVFIAGIVLLWKGSDALVTGTSKTAAQIGISSMIISVILVGFGTSAPEFAISGGAAIQNNADSAGISLGNIIGSCVANILLVLGIGAVISPLSVKKGVIKREAELCTCVNIFSKGDGNEESTMSVRMSGNGLSGCTGSGKRAAGGRRYVPVSVLFKAFRYLQQGKKCTDQLSGNRVGRRHPPVAAEDR